MATAWRFTAAPAAVANRFVTSVNMANGAYTLANTTQPTAGARKITATITGVTGNDTPGTLTLTGTNLAGQVITEVLTLTAGGLATSTRYFKTLTSAVQAGWVINTGNDTIVVGCDASPAILDIGGRLHRIVIGTTAAGTIVVADATGTLLTLGNSFPVGSYPVEIDADGFLTAVLGAASDVTFITSDPTTS